MCIFAGLYLAHLTKGQCEFLSSFGVRHLFVSTFSSSWELLKIIWPNLVDIFSMRSCTIVATFSAIWLCQNKHVGFHAISIESIVKQWYNKERKEKPKGQSKDIIQTQETTEQQTTKRHKTQNTSSTNKRERDELSIKWEWTQVLRKSQQFLPVATPVVSVAVSPVVVTSGKGKETPTTLQKNKSVPIWSLLWQSTSIFIIIK